MKKTIKNKNAQITIFIILGLILLLIFGFLFYISKTTTRIKAEKQFAKQSSDILTTTPLKYYIKTCLDNSLKKGLELIGKQGGFIYNNTEGGLINMTVSIVKFNNSNISVKIIAPNFSQLPYPASNRIVDAPYKYPCYVSALSNDLPSQYADIIGELCHKNFNIEKLKIIQVGELEELPLNLCKTNITYPKYSCKCRNPKYCDLSIQSQLEHYILNQTISCVNFSIIKGYNVTSGAARVDVSITNTGVAAALNYPLIINVKGNPPETNIGNFFSSQPVRLLDIYSIIYGTNNDGILLKEFSNITYMIREDGQEYANIRKNFTVELKKFQNFSIIYITDISSKHMLEDKNYVFQFALLNRAPVIEYFTNNSCTEEGIIYDACIEQNKILVVRPKVYDFDNDSLFVNYTGWNSTPVNAWQNSQWYNNGNLCSIPYSEKISKVCAGINATQSGAHNLTITVKDGVRTDNQTITIYVKS